MSFRQIGFRLDQATWDYRREFRVTRNDSRIRDPQERQGYYIKATSALHAAKIMAAKHPDSVTGDNDWVVALEHGRGNGVGCQVLHTRDYAIQLWS